MSRLGDVNVVKNETRASDVTLVLSLVYSKDMDPCEIVQGDNGVKLQNYAQGKHPIRKKPTRNVSKDTFFAITTPPRVASRSPSVFLATHVPAEQLSYQSNLSQLSTERRRLRRLSASKPVDEPPFLPSPALNKPSIFSTEYRWRRVGGNLRDYDRARHNYKMRGEPIGEIGGRHVRRIFRHVLLVQSDDGPLSPPTRERTPCLTRRLQPKASWVHRSFRGTVTSGPSTCALELFRGPTRRVNAPISDRKKSKACRLTRSKVTDFLLWMTMPLR